MELLKLKPVFKEMIWGGGKLGTIYGKPIPSDRTGESWEAASQTTSRFFSSSWIR